VSMKMAVHESASAITDAPNPELSWSVGIPVPGSTIRQNDICRDIIKRQARGCAASKNHFLLGYASNNKLFSDNGNDRTGNLDNDKILDTSCII
jgi:hypothetical protein